MSWFDREASRHNAGVLFAIAGCLTLGLTTGCTVSPLYSNQPAETGYGAVTADLLSSIAIKPVTTRAAQEVRNHLIYLLNGGAGQPAQAAYSLELQIVSETIDDVMVQIPSENDSRASAGTVIMTANYILRDPQSKEPVSQGTRAIRAPFDRPRQDYAVYRAEKDAQDRAARELAEALRMALALDFSRQVSTGS